MVIERGKRNLTALEATKQEHVQLSMYKMMVSTRLPVISALKYINNLRAHANEPKFDKNEGISIVHILLLQKL